MEKGIKITIKNGLYKVTLANVNGKEMMLSIGTLLQSVYSHAKQNGVEDKFEKDIRHIVDNVFENSFAKDTTNGKDSKSYEASLKSRTDELKNLLTLQEKSVSKMMNCFRRQKRQPKLYQAILMKI